MSEKRTNRSVYEKPRKSSVFHVFDFRGRSAGTELRLSGFGEHVLEGFDPIRAPVGFDGLIGRLRGFFGFRLGDEFVRPTVFHAVPPSGFRPVQQRVRTVDDVLHALGRRTAFGNAHAGSHGDWSFVGHYRIRGDDFSETFGNRQCFVFPRGLAVHDEFFASKTRHYQILSPRERFAEFRSDVLEYRVTGFVPVLVVHRFEVVEVDGDD